MLLTFLHSTFLYLQLQYSCRSKEIVQHQLQIIFYMRYLRYEKEVLPDMQGNIV